MQINKEQIIFILNPNSGSSKGFDSEIAFLEKQNISYYLSLSVEAFDVFMRTNTNQYKVFVLVGGDGTINHFLQYLVLYPHVIMAVLPNGSGNGFAREMGYKKDIQHLVSKILNGKTKKVDLIQVNNQLSCNMIGVGIDSLIAQTFSSSTKRGLLTYIKLTLKEIFKFKPINATIKINNQTITGNYLMVNVANTRQFGNNAFVSPKSKYNDGQIELVLLEPMPIYYLLIRVIQMFTKSLKTSKYLTYIKTNELEITSNAGYYHLDGEPFELNKKALKIEVKSSFLVIDPT